MTMIESTQLVSMDVVTAIQFAIDIILKGSILILATWLIVSLLRSKLSASVRGYAWTMVVFGLLLLPVASVVVPEWRVEVFPNPVNISGFSRAVDPQQISSDPHPFSVH